MVRAISCLVAAAAFSAFSSSARAALGDAEMVSAAPSKGAFSLARPGTVAPLFLSESDWPGVMRAAKDLQGDIGKVTGLSPSISIGGNAPGADAVIIGTLGHSALIDGLASAGKIDV